MTGLTAASELRRNGRDVLVIDKGRSVGGRMASRRVGAATFDHGAQFLTAKHSRFAAAVDGWLEAGVVEEWWGTSDGETGSHPRWRGSPTMTAVAKHLARDVEVLLGTRALALEAAESGWLALLEDGRTLAASTALLTSPVPQSLELLSAGRVDLPRVTREHLEGIEYERCLAVLAVLDGPTQIHEPGCFQPANGPIAWIADNQKKGVSGAAAVTIHASPEFSAANWRRDRRDSGRALIDAATEWLGAEVTEFQVHGWLYSKPLRTEEDPCLIARRSPLLVLAGDAFAGPRVEGAALSGWAAAEALMSITRST
jgi:predicted NAD/FAD-dependent oxidoreductase